MIIETTTYKCRFFNVSIIYYLEAVADLKEDNGWIDPFGDFHPTN